jgi:hypothetical protein
MNLDAWHYFLSMEKVFVATTDYVEVAPNNALLLLIGSEVDVVAKQVCQRKMPTRSVGTIGEYRDVLTDCFKDIHTIEIAIPRYRRKEQPWFEWGAGKSPTWWVAYNNVKHQRDTHFADANQQNVLAALCGLFALNLYFYWPGVNLQPYPQLLDYDFPRSIVTDGGYGNLPGT